MTDKTEQDTQRKAEELLCEHAGILPVDFDSLYSYLKTARNMLKYHFGDSGIHFDAEKQERLEQLIIASDVHVLEFNRLQFQAQNWASDAEKKILSKKPFSLDKNEVNQFKKEFQALQNEISKLGKETHQLLLEVLEMHGRR